LSCVGASDNKEVPARLGFDCRRKLFQLLVEWNDLFAFHVAAALRPNLIFQEHPRGPHTQQLLDRPDHIDGIAITSVRVDDHRRIDH
jgi:hypothetical protein